MSDLPVKYRSLSGTIFHWFEEELYTKSDKQQSAVVEAFMSWFQDGARLRPIPDLDTRIASMEPRLQKLAKNLVIEVQEGKVVIRSDADSMTLLSLLRRGSNWFDPHPGVDEAIMFALLGSA